MLDKTFFMKDNVCAGKKNYKSRCISINIVTFNQVGRKILKISCATLSLFAMIHSSDVATNRITDFYHASAVKNSENKNSKIQNSKKEDNKDNIVVSKKAIPDKIRKLRISSERINKDVNRKAFNMTLKTMNAPMFYTEMQHFILHAQVNECQAVKPQLQEGTAQCTLGSKVHLQK